MHIHKDIDSNLLKQQNSGQVYEKMEDENTACHWQTEAHRHYPVNLNVIRCDSVF